MKRANRERAAWLRWLVLGGLLSLLLSTYSSQACPYIDSLPPAVMAGTILAAFLLTGLVRLVLTHRLVRAAPVLSRPHRQFLVDSFLFVLAGIIAAVTNYLAYGFPFQSGIHLFTGATVGGLYMGLDQGLTRERITIYSAGPDWVALPPGVHLRPMAKRLVMAAILMGVCLVVVVGAILSRDIHWFGRMAASDMSTVSRTVSFEVLFVVSVLTGLTLNLIISFAMNLRLLFGNITGVLHRVSQGDLTQTVPVATADEFGLIAADANRMIEGLRHRVRLLSAMKVAEEVQHNLLPGAVVDWPGLEIAAISRYSEETGGDYYDLIPLATGRLGVAVGDVSGHGVGPALLMASARAFLRMAWDQWEDPAEVASQVNRRLARDVLETGRFLTMFLLEVDTEARKLRWVRAGHDPALLYDPRDGSFHELSGRGIAFGVLEGAVYRTSESEGWTPGSLVFVGTDGIWETKNPEGDMFDRHRLKAVMRANAAKSPDEIIQAVLTALVHFRGSSPQEDDVTMVVLRLN